MSEILITPEMVSMLLNNGLGGAAIFLMIQLNNRLTRAAAIIQRHEHRIAELENKQGIVAHSHFIDV